MNCFMGYNPLVAKDVKVTTWIKEFDGAEPIAPIFPNEGDCFIVFATDEDATTHNALSSKTYKDGEWVDAEGGTTPTGTITITENGEGIDVADYAYADVNVSGGGGGDLSTAQVTIIGTVSGGNLCSAIAVIPDYNIEGTMPFLSNLPSPISVVLYKGKAYYQPDSVQSVSGNIEYDSDLQMYVITGDCTITFS